MKFRKTSIYRIFALLVFALSLTGCNSSKVNSEDIPADSESVTVSIEVKDPSKSSSKKDAFTVFIAPSSVEIEPTLTRRFELAWIISHSVFLLLILYFWFSRWDDILAGTEGVTFADYRLKFKAEKSFKGLYKAIPVENLLRFLAIAFVLLLSIPNLYGYFWQGERFSSYTFFAQGVEVIKYEASAYLYNVLLAIPYGFMTLFLLGSSAGLAELLTNIRIKVSVSKTNQLLGLTPISKKPSLGWQLREIDDEIETLRDNINASLRALFYPQDRHLIGRKKIRINPQETIVNKIEGNLEARKLMHSARLMVGERNTGYLHYILNDEDARNDLKEIILKKIEEKKKEITHLKKIADVVQETQQLFNVAKARVEKKGKKALAFQQKLDEIIKNTNENKELAEYIKQSDWTNVHQVMNLVLENVDNLYQTASGYTSNQAEGSQPPSHDPYIVLGVSKTMTSEQIKKIYLELCHIYHPDKGKVKDDDKFKEIQNAYEQIRKQRNI